MPLTRSSSRKSVESSQGSDEMEMRNQSSQDYLFDSSSSEEDKTVIKDYIQYHQEWIAYLEKLRYYEIRNLGWPPRKSQSKLPSSLENSSSRNTTKRMSQLSGEKLNQFSKKQLDHLSLSKWRSPDNRPIYMVVLASAVEGSFDVKRAGCNWTKTRTLKLCVYMRFRTTGLGVLCCWL